MNSLHSFYSSLLLSIVVSPLSTLSQIPIQGKKAKNIQEMLFIPLADVDYCINQQISRPFGIKKLSA